MNRFILFQYIAAQIIFSSCFCAAACMIVGELVGVSFEQMRLISDNKISLVTSASIHVFSIPKFLMMTMPYALFMANIFVYKELSRSSEIVALFSFGISVIKTTIPCIAIGLLMANFAFCFQELVLPDSNYKAAVILEKAMGINRTSIELDDFIYRQFDNSLQAREVNLLLHAKKATDKAMRDLIVLYFDRKDLRGIIIAKVAYWMPKLKIWRLHEGIEEIIDGNKRTTIHEFKVCDLKTSYTLNELLNQSRDTNELNTYGLIKRLNVFKEDGHVEEVQKLEKSIQERFVMPFSCIAFSLVGASIGISLKPRKSGNELSLGLTIILIYSLFQMLNSALIGQGNISVYSVWIPNLLGVVYAFLRLARIS